MSAKKIQLEDDMAIEIRGMAPLLQVFDMPTSIKFYRYVLGFEVVKTSPPSRGALRLGAASVEWRGVDAEHGLRTGRSAVGP
jgi:catechol 2,3-dioxygenase-like lactoylglutathione lyase family enzyme